MKLSQKFHRKIRISLTATIVFDSTYILIHEYIFRLVVKMQENNHVTHRQTRDVFINFAILGHAFYYDIIERQNLTVRFIYEISFLKEKKKTYVKVTLRGILIFVNISRFFLQLFSFVLFVCLL